MSAAPAYASSPRAHDVGQISAANANRDGTGTIVSIASGSATGFRVQEIVVQPTVTTTLGMVRIFLSTDSGTTWRLFDEITIGAATVGAGVPGSRNSRPYSNLVLFGTTARLGASTHNAEAMNVFALGADL